MHFFTLSAYKDWIDILIAVLGLIIPGVTFLINLWKRVVLLEEKIENITSRIEQMQNRLEANSQDWESGLIEILNTLHELKRNR